MMDVSRCASEEISGFHPAHARCADLAAALDAMDVDTCSTEELQTLVETVRNAKASIHAAPVRIALRAEVLAATGVHHRTTDPPTRRPPPLGQSSILTTELVDLVATSA